MTAKRALLALLMLAACSPSAPSRAQPAAGPTGGSAYASEADAQWRLPANLREISGLAISPDGRLFAHDDEQAVIYEIDSVAGGIVKAFALGETPLAGDFEGLAIAGDGAFWLTDSHGVVYRFGEGADGAHVAYERFDTGLGEICEIEGLVVAPTDESLILACKQNHARGMRDTVSLYAWRFSGAPTLWRSWPEAELAEAAGVERFRPSSLDYDARAERFVMLSAADPALIEFGADGALLSARALAGHPQPEGVAALPDGALAIADEGRGGRALLSLYPGRHE